MARAWIEDTWFTRAPDGSKIRTQRHGKAYLLVWPGTTLLPG